MTSSTPNGLYGKVNPKLIFLLIAVYTGFQILALAKNIYYLNRQNFPLSEMPYGLFLLDWIAMVTFITLIALNTRTLLNKRIAWKKIVAFHFIMALAVNAVIRYIIEVYTFVIMGKKSLSELTFDHLLNRYMAYIDINYLLYFIMLFIIYAYYYTEQIRIGERKKRALETELLNTKVRLLSSQIQPHFLFNSLNSIVSLIRFDQDKAIKTVVDLSYFLRNTLNFRDEQFVPVKIELEILCKYLNIIKTRFDDQITINKKIVPEVLNAEIPFLLIQPIVENSIKHGFKDGEERLQIDISIQAIGEDYLEVTIQNDGVPLKNPEKIFSKGLGVSNIHKRLESLYNKNFEFKIRNLSERRGVLTYFKIPIAQIQPDLKYYEEKNYNWAE